METRCVVHREVAERRERVATSLYQSAPRRSSARVTLRRAHGIDLPLECAKKAARGTLERRKASVYRNFLPKRSVAGRGERSATLDPFLLVHSSCHRRPSSDRPSMRPRGARLEGGPEPIRRLRAGAWSRLAPETCTSKFPFGPCSTRRS